MKKLISLLFSIYIILNLVGCDDTLKYKENNPELHVIATNSLIGVFGNERDMVLVLETDDYGRTMFAYKGKSLDGPVLAVLIAQKTTRLYSYFYDNENAILCEVDECAQISSEMIPDYFTEDQLKQLKERNDWNQEIDEQKLFRIPITRKKIDKFSSKIKREAFQLVSDDFHPSYSRPLTTDKNGNTIYYMRGYRYEDELDDYVFTKSYLFMFDKNGKVLDGTGIMEVTDPWNYQEQLREFKELNGWSFYYQ